MMSLLNKWNKFWFTSSPYLDLAVIRLFMVALQLFLMLKAYSLLVSTMNLPDEVFMPLPALKILMAPWGWGVRPDQFMIMALFWGTVSAGLLALVGLVTNLSLFLFAVGNIFLQAFIYSFGEQHHPEAIMMIALLVFSFGPCGRVISIDSLLKGRGKKHNAQVSLLEYGSQFAAWPIKLMQSVFALIYLSAVTSKLVHGGFDWVNGITLQYSLVQDGLRWGSELALWLSQFHYFIFFVQILVVVFQATFFLVIFFPKLRWVYLPLGLIFHIGIYLTLRAPFPEWILLYALFVPWSRVFHWLASSVVVTEKPVGQGA